jgi:hypothetical protein
MFRGRYRYMSLLQHREEISRLPGKTEPVTPPVLGRRTNNLTLPHCYLSTPHPKLIQLRQMHQKKLSDRIAVPSTSCTTTRRRQKTHFILACLQNSLRHQNLIKLAVLLK